MKKTIRNLACAALLALSAGLQAQDNFAIEGKMSKIKDGTILNLMYQQNGKLIMDSAVVNNGRFAFSGEITEPVKARIMVKQPQPQMAAAFSEGKKMQQAQPAQGGSQPMQRASQPAQVIPMNGSAPVVMDKDSVVNDGSPRTTLMASGNISSSNISPSKSSSQAAKPIRPMIPMQRPDFVEVFLEKGKLMINGKDSLSTSVIKGGSNQKDLNEYNALTEPVNKKLQGQMMQLQADEAQGKDVSALKDQLKLTEKELNKMNSAFVTKRPDSYVSLGVVQMMSFFIEPEVFEPIYNQLSPRLRASEKGKIFATKLAAARELTVGKPAKEIVQNDPQNVPVKLSSLKGKYVLIDFWASWCGPCRAENPNVLKVYEKFKDKGFEVYAVSLDDKKDLWIEAIKKDGLPWVHVSDLKGWKNQAAADYSVSGVPQNYLVSPEGVIIARNLRGDELSQRLAEFIH